MTRIAAARKFAVRIKSACTDLEMATTFSLDRYHRLASKRTSLPRNLVSPCKDQIAVSRDTTRVPVPAHRAAARATTLLSVLVLIKTLGLRTRRYRTNGEKGPNGPSDAEVDDRH